VSGPTSVRLVQRIAHDVALHRADERLDERARDALVDVDAARPAQQLCPVL